MPLIVFRQNNRINNSSTDGRPAMKKRHRQAPTTDNIEPHHHPAASANPVTSLPFSALSPSPSGMLALPLPLPATRRSISMGDFRRVTMALYDSEQPSTATTAPSSKMVTPSSSMEFEAARRRLLEMEERQRVIQEMERRLEELREVFVRSEQEAVEHGEVVTRIACDAQQGEMYTAENSQRFKKHRPIIIFTSMLGLRTCLPWPVKLK